MQNSTMELTEVAPEISKEEELKIKLSNLSKSHRRSSLYDFDFGVCASKSDEIKDTLTEYDHVLHKEIEEWGELLKKTNEKNKNMKKLNIEYGQEILCKEHVQYMKQIPNFKEYLEDSKDLCIKCNNLFEIYEETLQLQQKLLRDCQDGVKKDILLNCILEL